MKPDGLKYACMPRCGNPFKCSKVSEENCWSLPKLPISVERVLMEPNSRNMLMGTPTTLTKGLAPAWSGFIMLS